MNCPNCQNELVRETYEGVEIDRCPKCRGTWLDAGEVSRVIATKEELFAPELVHQTLQQAFGGYVLEEEASVELCPKCQVRLEAINYQYKTGVIIDSCPQGHGVWLDVDELEMVQVHSEQAETDYSTKGLQWRRLAQETLEKREAEADARRKSELDFVTHAVNKLVRKLFFS